MKTTCQNPPTTSGTAASGAPAFPTGADPALTDTLGFIHRYGRVVVPRPASAHDLYGGLGIDDPALVAADGALLRLAWPSEAAHHLFRSECSEIWGLPPRRTNEALLRMRQRGWIEMWSWFGVFSYHLLPAGATLLTDAVADR